MSSQQHADSQRRLISRALARALDIEGLRVTIVRSTPYLEGTVPSFECKQRAARIAGLAARTGRIVNRLRVAPCTCRTDDAVVRDVEAILLAIAAVGFPLSVGARDGVISLDGKVASPAERSRLESLAWSARGVRGIRNSLAVASTGGVEHNPE